MNRTENHIAGLRLENTYASLPDSFFAAATPGPAPAPRIAILNHRLAQELGLDFDALAPEAAAAFFSGQQMLHGSMPIAQAYAGHQYGGFTMLGDGRAILLGEQRTPEGRLVDIQLKGAGRTRYSRGGDGRAALGPMLREYIISEAMAALGIPTTRSLAVVTTGEAVYRESVRKGAILTRVAASHIRVGTFQFQAARGDEKSLRLLADYSIARHFPEVADAPQPYAEFFRAVAARQAALLARWQLVGFIHGVMNTDNMAISGETIDYGPCAFMNAYDPDTVFSSIDSGGRYAYGNQPRIAEWNLARFAETLLPLLDADQDRAIAIATELLGEFQPRHEGYWLVGMRAKLGLLSAEEGDGELARSLLEWMHRSGADFTNTFRDLAAETPAADDPEFLMWRARWLDRLGREDRTISAARTALRAVNPAVVPRNHRVEEALAAAEERDDLTVLHRLLDALATPFEDRPEMARYRDAGNADSGYRTFCGT